MTENHRQGTSLVTYVMIAVPALLVLAQAAYFYHLNASELGLGMPIDDAYIFKRYAENIAHGHGYSFNPG